LIDLGAILLTDVPMMAYQLNDVFRIAYRYDAKNSNFGMLKAFDRNIEIETVNHFAAEQPPLPPLLPPGVPPPPSPQPPRNVPDIRSVLFHFRYSISELPGPGFRARLADDRVGQQPDNADWDPADVRYSTLRWFAGYPDPGFAEGPSRVNPLTGEIYDADIRFDAGMTRFFRREINEYVNPAGTPWMPWMEEPRKPFLAPWHNRPAEFCDLVGGAVRDAEFAFDLLTARGMDPQGPEANQFVHDYLVEIAAHEVGHTLGLRHNFRASTIHTLEQAQDATLTAKEGLTGSVMDYIPTNISTEGQKQGPYHQTTLGPYDYWAIEYAYKPIAANTPDEELPELAKIASRAAEPQLAYDTDEERGGGPFDMDPG